MHKVERPQSFGALLREHRLRVGLTQAELAEAAGLSERGIQVSKPSARGRTALQSISLRARSASPATSSPNSKPPRRGRDASVAKRPTR